MKLDLKLALFSLVFSHFISTKLLAINDELKLPLRKMLSERCALILLAPRSTGYQWGDFGFRDESQYRLETNNLFPVPDYLKERGLDIRVDEDGQISVLRPEDHPSYSSAAAVEVGLNPVDDINVYLGHNELWVVAFRSHAEPKIIKVTDQSIERLNAISSPYSLFAAMTRLHPIPKFGKIKITKIFSSYLNQTRLAYGFLKRYSLGQVAFEERAIWVDTALLETLSKRKGFDSIQGLVGYEEVIEFPGMSDPVEVMLREKSTVPDVLRPRQIFDEIAYYLLRAEVPKLTLFTGNELRYTASKVKDPNTRLNTALQELSNGKIYLVAVEENDALRTKLEAPHAELFRLVHPNLDEKQIIVVDINSLNFMAEGLNEP